MMLQELAEKYGLSVQELKAVVFYEDGSWERTYVFGEVVVAQTIQAKIGSLAPASVIRKALSALTECPEDGRLDNASFFGLQSGKVLLVPHLPTG